jgi:hypothetical protein
VCPKVLCIIVCFARVGNRFAMQRATADIGGDRRNFEEKKFKIYFNAFFMR